MGRGGYWGTVLNGVGVQAGKGEAVPGLQAWSSFAEISTRWGSGRLEFYFQFSLQVISGWNSFNGQISQPDFSANLGSTLAQVVQLELEGGAGREAVDMRPTAQKSILCRSAILPEGSLGTSACGWWWAGIFLGPLLLCVCLVTQLCPTFCDSVVHSLPGSSVHGISQARILLWVAIPFSRGSSWPTDWIQVSCVSCISGGLFTHWAIGKTLSSKYGHPKRSSRPSLAASVCQAGSVSAKLIRHNSSPGELTG